MGALQEALTTQCSSDIVCTAGYSKMVPYDKWNKQVSINYTGQSGPVTTIILGKSDVDTVLNKLGVVQRVRGSASNSIRVDHSLPIGDIRKIPAINRAVQTPKVKLVSVGLQPKELTSNDLQECIDGDIKYQEIMEMYGFTSERYFKEVLKAKGYRLLRNELWVLEDRLWLN